VAISAGIRQRVAYARMLLHIRPFILLDEPASSQDLVGQELIAATSSALLMPNGDPVTVLAISHQANFFQRPDHMLVKP